MLGLAFTSWASWVCGTLAGAWSGNGLLVDYPAVEAALGFMLPALFMSFLLASFQRQQSLCVWRRWRARWAAFCYFPFRRRSSPELSAGV